MKEITKTVLNASGIHARPAGIFIAEAKKFQSKITVTNLTTEKSADAKSILRVMTLCLTKGTPIKITAEGKPEDADLASSVTISIGGFLALIAKAMQ